MENFFIKWQSAAIYIYINTTLYIYIHSLPHQMLEISPTTNPIWSALPSHSMRRAWVGVPYMWWYAIFVMVCHLCDGMPPFLWWYAIFVMICHLCDGMPFLRWYAIYVMVCHLCDGMPFMWWYAAIFVMVCHFCNGMPFMWW